MFLQVSVCPRGGGSCVVALGGGAMVAPGGGGMHGCSRGACLVAPGGVHGFFDEIRSMSGQYASYWNAFLWSQCFYEMYQTKTGEKLNDPTRLHSGRMRTAHLLTVSPSMHYAGGVCLVRGGAWCQGGLLPGEVPGLGGGGVCSWGMGFLVRGYPSVHLGRPPCEQNDGQTGVKTQPSQTSFAGGNNLTPMKMIMWQMVSHK